MGMWVLGTLLLAYLHSVSGVSSPPVQANTPGNDDHFVAVDDGDFVVGCEAFYPAIYNQWEVLEMASGAPVLLGASLPDGLTGPALLRQTMDTAAGAGLNTLRMWTNGVTPAYAVQRSPGVYNEGMLRGLDYVLDQARQRNLKVILVLLDNWQQTGGIQDYIEWAKNPALTHADFYTNPQIKQWYKNYVRALVTRVNTVNGIKYSDDATIFSWELLNEPRCTKCPPGTIANWIEENAAYVKSLDPNHMVGVGEEGFYSSTASRLNANPGSDINSPWASQEGQDFIADHSSPDIDYAAFHSWIDSWAYPLGNVSEQQQRNWIDVHVQDGATLKKPILLEEFGKWLNATVRADMAQRNLYFRIVFDEANKLINTPGSYLKGLGFWQFYGKGQIAPVTEGGGQGLYGIYASDETFNLIRQEAAFLASKNGPVAGACDPNANKAAGSPKSCTGTIVGGLPGTGLEGGACNVDINECVRGTDNCANNATCINTNGGFQCKCWTGFAGDGTTCTPTPLIAQLPSLYTDVADQGPLVCDIPYPMNAPGFNYDPTGALQDDVFSTGKQDGVGNVGPVTSLEQCFLACETAPGCTAVAYSPGWQNCFLKGCPGKYATTCPVPPAPNAIGGINGPPKPPPAPTPPPAPPCTLPDLALCPPEPKPYFSYYSTQRYDPRCTYIQNNPGLVLAPAPSPGKLIIEQVSSAMLPPATSPAATTARATNPVAPAGAPTVVPTAPSSTPTANPIVSNLPQTPPTIKPAQPANPQSNIAPSSSNPGVLQSALASLLAGSNVASAGR